MILKSLFLSIKNRISGLNSNRNATSFQYKKLSLSEIEQEIDFIFPQEYKDYYQSEPNIHNYALVDPHFFTALEIIDDINSYGDELIRFADSMLHCPWYAFSKNSNKIYKGYGFDSEFKDETIIIAENFTEFLALIEEDSSELY